MREQGYIGRAKYQKSLGAGLGLERGYRYETREEQYFFDFVQRELIDRYGVTTVRDGGLKVFDARARAAGRRRSGDRRSAHHPQRVRGPGLDPHRDRRDPRDGLLGGI